MWDHNEEEPTSPKCEEALMDGKAYKHSWKDYSDLDTKKKFVERGMKQ